MSHDKPVRKLPRREFLANILFAGGMLTVGSLEQQYPLIARKDSPKADWSLPEDSESDGSKKDEGWELPEDLMTSPSPPPVEPRRYPQPMGGLQMPRPTPRGKYVPPAPPPKPK